MTTFIHEMKQNTKMLLIWGITISALMSACMLLFPQMQSSMEEVSKVYSSMGAFTEAFGMDQLSFGTPMGFYGIECGNIFGLGGAFFAAFIGVSMLAKEENSHTAEFLFTHGIGRYQIILEKLLALTAILVIFNAFCVGVSAISFALIGETIKVKAFLLFHLAQFIMQLEIAAICFAISALIRRGSAGIGLGIATLLYFLNVIANISKDAEWLKYITPFHYSDAADVISKVEIDEKLLLLGCLYMVVSIAIAFWYYGRKDLAS
jgi:ABC-2 type transport system permease protein